MGERERESVKMRRRRVCGVVRAFIKVILYETKKEKKGEGRLKGNMRGRGKKNV